MSIRAQRMQAIEEKDKGKQGETDIKWLCSKQSKVLLIDFINRNGSTRSLIESL